MEHVLGHRTVSLGSTAQWGCAEDTSGLGKDALTDMSVDGSVLASLIILEATLVYVCPSSRFPMASECSTRSATT